MCVSSCYCMCPHIPTQHVVRVPPLRLLYVSSFYHMYPHTAVCVFVILYMCPHTPTQHLRVSRLRLRHVCPRTTMCVPSYHCICVLLLLHMCPCIVPLHVCPHTATQHLRAPSDYDMCPRTTIYVSSYYYMCPHTPTCVSSYSYTTSASTLRLHMCPRTTVYMSSYTTTCVSSYAYYVRVLTLLHNRTNRLTRT
jgi:hypothetical protein